MKLLIAHKKLQTVLSKRPTVAHHFLISLKSLSSAFANPPRAKMFEATCGIAAASTSPTAFNARIRVGISRVGVSHSQLRCRVDHSQLCLLRCRVGVSQSQLSRLQLLADNKDGALPKDETSDSRALIIILIVLGVAGILIACFVCLGCYFKKSNGETMDKSSVEPMSDAGAAPSMDTRSVKPTSVTGAKSMSARAKMAEGRAGGVRAPARSQV